MAKTLSDLTRWRFVLDGVRSILRLPSAFLLHKATVPKLPLFKSFSNSYTSQNLRPLLSQTSCSRKSRFWGDGGCCFGCEGAQPISAPRVRRLLVALRQRFGRCRRCKMRHTKHCEVQPRTCARASMVPAGVRVARRVCGPPRRLLALGWCFPRLASFASSVALRPCVLLSSPAPPCSAAGALRSRSQTG